MIGHPTGKFDNAAEAYRQIEAVPLSAAMGAEIRGVDLANLRDDQFEEIEHALFRHKMIYFRDQKISHGDQEAFSLRFGPFAEDAYTKGVEGHRNVQPVVKEADAKVAFIFGSGWHTDSPFLQKPPAISMLYGVDIPPYGGDTMWANSALAYSMLSDGMKQILDPLEVHMSMKNVLAAAQDTMEPGDSPIGRLAATRGGGPLPDDVARKVEGSFHPLVRTHPRSAEKALYCDRTYAVGIKGLDSGESRPILDFLVGHITQPAFTCRLRWEPNTLTLWDNRLCVHQAFNDHDGYRREMYRTTVAGRRRASGRRVTQNGGGGRLEQGAAGLGGDLRLAGALEHVHVQPGAARPLSDFLPIHEQAPRSPATLCDAPGPDARNAESAAAPRRTGSDGLEPAPGGSELATGCTFENGIRGR